MNSDARNFNIPGLIGFRKKKPGRDKKYATFNRRMLAATIDSLLLMFLTPFFNRWIPIRTDSLQKYTVDSGDPRAAQHYLFQILTDHSFMTSWLQNMMAQMLVYCLLSAICWHFWSATPGKMLLRLKIVDAKSEGRITGQQIILRVCGYIPSGLCFLLGFFWIGIDKRGQAWHDKLANTLVVTLPWLPKKETTL